MLAARLTEFSRNHAIANSNEFVSHIERYRAQYGHYPVSLAAMWKDYYPDVVGIERFHYAPYGESYNLFFEQPKLLFDNFGTREWVVYNPSNEHRMFSHTACFLLLTPEELEEVRAGMPSMMPTFLIGSIFGLIDAPSARAPEPEAGSPNKITAPNAGIELWFNCDHHRPGVGEFCHSAHSDLS